MTTRFWTVEDGKLQGTMYHPKYFRAAQTRRNYQWWGHAWDNFISEFSLYPRTLKQLDRFSDMVMQEEAHDYRRILPRLFRQTSGTSGCHGLDFIFMSPRQYCYGVLLHELTHALGYRWHTAGFTYKYIDLLVRYGRCKEGPLIISAGLYGVI